MRDRQRNLGDWSLLVLLLVVGEFAISWLVDVMTHEDLVLMARNLVKVQGGTVR